jgi:hypothetical protein
MNRRHYTIMTIDDHRAAAREWATAHRSVAEFENISRTVRGAPGRLHTNVKRIDEALERIRTEMREVLLRTLPAEAHKDSCWRAADTAKAATAALQRATRVWTLDDHIAAARALGPSQPAVRRFAGIISNRRHLPVRIMDDAIRVLHLIQFVRCQMEDVQFYTLRGRGIPWVNCWLGRFNYFDGDETGNTDQDKTTLEV